MEFFWTIASMTLRVQVPMKEGLLVSLQRSTIVVGLAQILPNFRPWTIWAPGSGVRTSDFRDVTYPRGSRYPILKLSGPKDH